MIYTRELKHTDISAVKEIITENWSTAVATNAVNEMEEMFFTTSLWPPKYIVALDEQNKIIGCAGYKSSWLMANTYEFIWINVLKRYQYQGVGSVLTRERLKAIEKLGGNLILVMTHTPFFFEKFGFNKTSEFDGWHLMTKKLNTVSLNYSLR